MTRLGVSVMLSAREIGVLPCVTVKIVLYGWGNSNELLVLVMGESLFGAETFAELIRASGFW